MDLKLGQATGPGQAGIRVVNADVLKVKADVPESYAGSVNTGNEVKILVPDANDSLVTKVSFAAKVIDPTSRSFGVEVKLPDRKSLRPNMTAIIQIANYSKTNTIVVPVKAILKSETGDYVFVNLNGIAKKVNVKSGTTYGGNTVMLGYLKDRAATDAAFDGGWFHTGDLAVQHPDGYMEIKDRAKDIIISGGENISSIEVEIALNRHPAVLMSAVVARPDAKWGETPCAFVQLRPDATATEEELIRFCRDNLPHFAIPKTVVFGALPTTSTGKVQKYTLRERARAL